MLQLSITYSKQLLLPQKGKNLPLKGDSRTKNTMTEYEKVKDFLEWLDREIPKEKDEKLKKTMIRIKGLILDRLREKGEI